MTVVRTLRLVRRYEWNIKTIVYVAVHDRPITETIIVGPVRYFTRRVLVTSRNISEAEVDRLVSRVLESDVRCRVCGRYGQYTKVDIKGGEPDLNTAVCDDCDPSARYALGLYEAIDIAFVETRGN
jgi:hypothetical protein